MLVSHYTDVCDSLSSTLKTVSAKVCDVPEIYHVDYAVHKDAHRFGKEVAGFLNGFWNYVVLSGLTSQGVPEDLAKAIVTEYFEEALPKWIASDPAVYAEYMQ